MNRITELRPSVDLFGGPGELRAVLGAVPWDATPLGPTERWPVSLQGAIRLALDAPNPVAIWAGPEAQLIPNEGFAALLGKSPWALKAGHPADGLEFVRAANLLGEIERVAATGAAAMHRDVPLGPPGEGGLAEVYLSYWAFPIREPDGRIVGVMMPFDDSSERVREAKHEEDLRNFMLAKTSIGAWDVEMETGRVLRGASAANLVESDESAPWSIACFFDYVPPEEHEAVRAAIFDGPVPRPEWQLECHLRVPSGESRWFWIASKRVATAPGEPVRSMGVCQDVTWRKKIEQELRDSKAAVAAERAQLQAILDTAPVGILVVDAEGRLSRQNPEAERLWRCATGDPSLLDAVTERLCAPGESVPIPREASPIRRALDEGASVEGQLFEAVRLDGAPGAFVVSSAPIRDPDGHPQGAIVAMLDVTELREAQRRIEEADRRKGQFIATLSHELRNPLSAIKNSLYVLDRAPLGGEQAQRAQKVIERQVGLLVRAASDIQDYTRLSTGALALERNRFDLGITAARAVEDHRATFEQGGIAFRVAVPERALPIDGDEVRIAQVLGKLLSNAAKFTPPGGRVAVALEVDEVAREAVLTVADSGAGIGPELLAKLFEPFVQADVSLERRGGGLGLGIAIAKGIVQEHGGRLVARSDGEGQGATFEVRLPLAPGLIAPVEGSGPSPTPGRQRVLIVEDNLDTAASFREFLLLEGLEVELAIDGPSGLLAVERFLPDVVLCDIGLPGIDGYELARAVRAKDELRDIRLVALTSYALDDDVRRAYEAGFDRHVAKPATLETIGAVLLELAKPMRAHEPA